MKKRSSTHRRTATESEKSPSRSGHPSAPHRASTKAPTFELLPDVPQETPSPEASSTATELNLETVRIGYFNPDARRVYVAGTFNDWEPNTLSMKRDKTGNWSVELALPPGEYRYRLIVDGEWRDHPGAARLIPNLYEGNDAIITV